MSDSVSQSELKPQNPMHAASCLLVLYLCSSFAGNVHSMEEGEGEIGDHLSIRISGTDREPEKAHLLVCHRNMRLDCTPWFNRSLPCSKTGA